MNFIWVWNVHLSGLNRFYFSLKGFYKGKSVKILILFSVESLITALIISECVIYYNGEGNGTPLQHSCLENPMDGGAWWAAVHGVAKSRTRLSDFTFTFHFPALEKEMATHSSVLAWRILGTGEPGGLPSMGSHRVRHDWSDLAAFSYLKVLVTLSCLCVFVTP